jgi:hypothetical protein
VVNDSARSKTRLSAITVLSTRACPSRDLQHQTRPGESAIARMGLILTPGGFLARRSSHRASEEIAQENDIASRVATRSPTCRVAGSAIAWGRREQSESAGALDGLAAAMDVEL